jgi:hypothetical protein
MLYDMCKDIPLHNIEKEIIAKIWLIGRSYASAIERGANSNNKGDDFYKNDVAKEVKAVGPELDRRIANLQTKVIITKELLQEIIETHNFLTKVFFKITGKENRSLASKVPTFSCAKYFIYIRFKGF